MPAKGPPPSPGEAMLVNGPLPMPGEGMAVKGPPPMHGDAIPAKGPPPNLVEAGPAFPSYAVKTPHPGMRTSTEQAREAMLQIQPDCLIYTYLRRLVVTICTISQYIPAARCKAVRRLVVAICTICKAVRRLVAAMGETREEA